MGKEVESKGYSAEETAEFHKRLEQETLFVKNLFDNNLFSKGNHKIGIELEAWLINNDMLPSPYSPKFLRELNHSQVVPEIAKFNFEINSSPYELEENCFKKLHHEMDSIWSECEKKAQSDNKHAMLVGTLPTLRPHMLEMKYLSPQNRYSIMNEQVMKLREGRPLYIRLEGRDNLYMYMDSVIAECAATSLQVHLTIDQEHAKRYYNASMIASPFMIALCANSPYFFGKELWDESRIAIFEQSVDLQTKTTCGKNIKRVTLGNGYIKESMFELYLENLIDYPTLLAELRDGEPEDLSHLSLQNGTIWRWTRPIIGKNEDGSYHLRLEQRSPSAGPTLIDSIANSAFFIGLVDYLATHEIVPEDIITFDELIHNFYKSSRQSFFCEVKWLDGKMYNMRDLLEHEIFPNVKKALIKRGIAHDDIVKYLDNVIYPRIKKGVNGAIWQKAFIHMHGKRFQELLEAYLKNQYSGLSVHEWEL